ncbi:hypothetical protein C8Q74DRAFT_810579 [Fomes fomentarius]|nr:hypothetical protein C8Q74DRAFT_810579 [Fomes fomentarius]
MPAIRSKDVSTTVKPKSELCPKCSRVFTKDKMRHMLTHEPPGIVCPYRCGYATRQQGNLNSHIHAIHLKDFAYQCRYTVISGEGARIQCPEVFNSPGQRTKHVNAAHANAPRPPPLSRRTQKKAKGPLSDSHENTTTVTPCGNLTATSAVQGLTLNNERQQAADRAQSTPQSSRIDAGPSTQPKVEEPSDEPLNHFGIGAYRPGGINRFHPYRPLLPPFHILAVQQAWSTYAAYEYSLATHAASAYGQQAFFGHIGTHAHDNTPL